MGWLTASEDEVSRFHPEFLEVANLALANLRIAHEYEWVHHLRTPGNTVIPDFVLVNRRTRRWIVAFELKRQREAVFSTRFQIQAKGYAEINQDLYTAGAPLFFALSNLEVTMLFAVNGHRPPRECRIEQGVLDSGRFDTVDTATHKASFVQHLEQIIALIVPGRPIAFESVWPRVLADYVAFTEALPVTEEILLAQPESPHWDLVQGYFGTEVPVDASRIFLLRCLMAEYLRGILMRYGHPDAGRIPPVRDTPEALARTIAAIRNIDFGILFEELAPDLYRNLANRELLDALRRYAIRITEGTGVSDLARMRVDYPQLIDDLVSTLVPVEMQDESGRVQTDPELAEILASLTIREPGSVLDPCCGDGALLSAAYDRLRALGSNNEIALASVAGIEVDTIAGRLASVRLALKEPRSISPDLEIEVLNGDMFASEGILAEAEYVLMNPPFKRYEAQDLRPVPPALRNYYNEAIESVNGEPATTTSGQANLFHYYVEFVTKTLRTGARVGFILDNRWYHNRYGKPLRRLFLDNFEIQGIVEYPHSAFFTDWSIASSLVIARKTPANEITPGHAVKFIRSREDPRGVDLNAIANALNRNAAWPAGWTCEVRPQEELDERISWKSSFASLLVNDFRLENWPTLDNLFAWSRRGSLQKEKGWSGTLEFPFGRTNYGPRLEALEGGGTARGRNLTRAENDRIREAANAMPEDFRGLALRNSDDTSGYVLSLEDVTKHRTLEAPVLRLNPQLFLLGRRSVWTERHNEALAQMEGEPATVTFVRLVSDIVNLNEDILPRTQLWNVFREPFAGELIIPRKMRTGHRVYVNPFAFAPHARQVRLSSNFISYGRCLALDGEINLDQETAVLLIGAFLVSTFGQLQFEIEGVNREGCLSIEKEQLGRIKVFDPRWIRRDRRAEIIAQFRAIPYPVATDRLSAEQQARNELDRLIAIEICERFPQFEAETLLKECHLALDEWLESRKP